MEYFLSCKGNISFHHKEIFHLILRIKAIKPICPLSPSIYWLLISYPIFYNNCFNGV